MGAIVMSVMVICIALAGGLFFYIQDKHNKKGVANA